MKTIKTTTLAVAAAVALGALSLTAAPALAKGGHGGGHGGGHHGGGFGGFKHGGHWGHWGHRRHYGWGYGYGIAAYAADCYFVRRYGAMIKICE